MNETDYMFKTQVTQNLPTYREFNQGYTESNRIVPICRIITIAAIIYYISNFDSAIFTYLYLILSAVFLIIYLIQTISNRNGNIHYKRMLNNNMGQPIQLETHFTEDGIQSYDVNLERRGANSYDQILWAFETKNLIVLMMKYRQGLMVNKNTLTGGSREEFLEFLKTHCPNWKSKKVRKGIFGRIVNRTLAVVLIMGILLAICCLPSVQLFPRLFGQITNNMTYLEIAEKLEPLGITGATAEMQTELDEYYGEFYTGLNANYYNKATDLLAWVGAGTYDEYTWEWTPSSNGVYWQDMEVWDVSCMYTDFLKGIAALNPGELSFSEITEDHSEVDYENWTGTIHLSFHLNYQKHEMDIPFDGDWISLEALSEIAKIVQAESNENQLYFASDEGQGILVFYRTPDWAKEFTAITRIHLYEDANALWYY